MLAYTQAQLIFQGIVGREWFKSPESKPPPRIQPNFVTIENRDFRILRNSLWSNEDRFIPVYTYSLPISCDL